MYGSRFESKTQMKKIAMPTEHSMTKIEALSQHSSYVENVLRHVFLSDLFRAAWQCDYTHKLHIYNNEVDDPGFDLVASLNGVLRHIQLKATHTDGRARDISAHTALGSAKGGCIIWMFYRASDLSVDHYRFFGEPAGADMLDISQRPAALTQRRDIKGQRRARLHHRKIVRSDFSDRLTAHELLDRLFFKNRSALEEAGAEPADNITHLVALPRTP